MADKDNVNDVVTTMLGDLSSADFSTKEDLVLKISLLIDTHAPDPDWCAHVGSCSTHRGPASCARPRWEPCRRALLPSFPAATTASGAVSAD
eukprot:263121-Chlamydomonas_euryale.AAC.1